MQTSVFSQGLGNTPVKASFDPWRGLKPMGCEPWFSLEPPVVGWVCLAPSLPLAVVLPQVPARAGGLNPVLLTRGSLNQECYCSWAVFTSGLISPHLACPEELQYGQRPLSAQFWELLSWLFFVNLTQAIAFWERSLKWKSASIRQPQPSLGALFKLVTDVRSPSPLRLVATLSRLFRGV